MCGIAGYVGGYVPRLAERMNDAQAHRGPDGRAVYESPTEQAALAHLRLAILDLTDSAAQPMHSPDGRYVLAFNGEIYNFRELRERLSGVGHTFRSTGDTEVLLHGLMAEGEGFLGRLNGMFALALWDRHDRELLLARDHLGVKPLYYAEPEPGTLLFASELKALYAYPSLAREVDPEVIQQHLAYCHAAGDRTALRAVRRLGPGSLLRWRATTRSTAVSRYWRPTYGDPPTVGQPAAATELRNRVRDGTVRQLVSDVPVGSFLSGGLDSSLITTFASRQVGLSFQCYTITYSRADNVLDGVADDAAYARRVTADLGLELNEIELKPEVAALWPKLVHHLDEPIADPAAISCYLISQLARSRGTTVLLSGQGADELLCGYPRYRAMRATRWFGRMPRPARQFITAGAAHLPGARGGRLGVGLRRVRKVLAALDGSPDEQFLNYCAAHPETAVTQVFAPDFRTALHGRRFKDECLEHMTSVGLTGSDRFQERDLTVYLPNHNLLYTDKMGMAVGLEARVPFLDLDLVEAATRYPAKWKLVGGVSKAILREAARGVVNDDVIDRPKAGFGAPYRKWLRDDLAPMWDELMGESAVRRRGWFDPAAVRDARQLGLDGRADTFMLQWALITVELWARQFIDRNPSEN